MNSLKGLIHHKYYSRCDNGFDTRDYDCFCQCEEGFQALNTWSICCISATNNNLKMSETNFTQHECPSNTTVLQDKDRPNRTLST
ncbi:uncharacterized protein K460DRAFT_93789 [Cucurbitaria berberidis CBS 394.84]|uniref:Uncharacterized protein n=1 Tax=Cucurbitaria berberidis CBS 394.84 TaxID=1168544 RepID=A0A9P4L753_9PLEO|nr:uncharacterized protein K460DRAFT_93789 [Cucurbitaria berberidis CBS 394.84]KAF1844550.1 hypothetical protein K460DRAFT_93789 [Cucurbitaria berberidis CBS 394.84]